MASNGRWASDSRELGLAPQSFTVRDIAFVVHTVATGGMMVTGQGSASRLSPVQFALVQLLAAQMFEDEGKHEAVRGFVSSGILLCSLPWDTAHPELGHLKQLVRRVRRRFEGSGLTVQSACGLGYRLEFEDDQRVSGSRLRCG